MRWPLGILIPFGRIPLETAEGKPKVYNVIASVLISHEFESIKRKSKMIDSPFSIDGKELHSEMVKRVKRLYDQGFYEEAVNNAFKVLEERLREVTGKQETGVDLAQSAFHDVTGMLRDPNAWPSERQGTFQLFRAAFMAVRNGPAHRFVGMTKAESFDQIVLANRLLLIADIAHQRVNTTAAGSPGIPTIDFRSFDAGKQPIALDVNNDSKSEIILSSEDWNEVLVAYEDKGGKTSPIVVETLKDGVPFFNNAALVDIDGDGVNELVCLFVGDTMWTALLFYKYQNGRLEILKSDQVKADPNRFKPHFFDAQIVDFDKDGKLEVLSEPWGTVPEELWPANRDKAERTTHPGRVRYVWKWDATDAEFKCIRRELWYIGGR